MLCRRSASLISRTRMSPAIATIILRTFSACSCSRVWNWSLSSFVRPSTISATSSPNSSSIRSRVTVGVLDRVVQQRGLERRRVQPQVGQDLRDRQRMLDEVLAREPLLPLVRLLGDPVGALERLEVGLRVVGADLLLQRLEPGGRMLVRGGGAAAGRRPPRRAGGCAVPTVSSSRVSTPAASLRPRPGRIPALSTGSV